MTAYKNQHPVSEIVLTDLSVESIARFIELKHFETLYTGNMLRQKLVTLLQLINQCLK